MKTIVSQNKKEVAKLLKSWGYNRQAAKFLKEGLLEQPYFSQWINRNCRNLKVDQYDKLFKLLD